MFDVIELLSFDSIYKGLHNWLSYLGDVMKSDAHFNLLIRYDRHARIGNAFQNYSKFNHFEVARYIIHNNPNFKIGGMK